MISWIFLVIRASLIGVNLAPVCVTHQKDAAVISLTFLLAGSFQQRQLLHDDYFLVHIANVPEAADELLIELSPRISFCDTGIGISDW